MVEFQPSDEQRKALSDLSGEIEHSYPLMNEVAAREGWDDPEMDVYDQLR
jgi:hypothetical protein